MCARQHIVVVSLLSIMLFTADAPSSPPGTPTRPQSPPERDSDGDGISDRDEDRNQNGIVDQGETDPKRLDTDGDNVPDDVERRMGSSPANAFDVPPIPEPLFIDLVRNLGSRRGELEANVLASTTFRRSPLLSWGPEIEYVPVSGLGVELEFPMSDHQVDAVKLGAQATVGSLAARRLDFGVLATHEEHIQKASNFTSLCSVVGVRFSTRVQALTIVGPTMTVMKAHRPTLGGLLSPSLFFQASRAMTLGLELGYRVTAGESSTQHILPQMHLSPTQHSKMQVGVGGANEGDGVVRLFSAIRVSWEH